MQDYINKIIHSDCLEALKLLPDNSIDSVVTDPPYELGFMNKSWDNSGIAYNVDFWKEVFRVLKPGGFLASFGGTRTYHRMACAIEDAGFEIRDQIQWLYGSGFPKSMDIGKTLDNKQGFGTALKPANEPIVLARKPISEKTVALNILKWNTGGININGCRVEMSQQDKNVLQAKSSKNPTSNYNDKDCQKYGDYEQNIATPPNDLGRYPANLILTHSIDCTKINCSEDCPIKVLDEQSGNRLSGKGNGNALIGEESNGVIKPLRRGSLISRNDSGGASRFFTHCDWDNEDLESIFLYCAKTSKKERNEGLENRNTQTVNDGRKKDIDNAFQRGKTERQNTHPTVKPKALIKWLVTLITPPGGTVIDPFAGSGTLGVAIKNTDFNCIMIEKEDEYIPIIQGRTGMNIFMP